jgi:hypothetical protein
LRDDWRPDQDADDERPVRAQIDFVGGAGIVAKHLKAAGGRVTFSTVLGDDEYRDLVEKDLAADGIDVRAIIDKSRPTVNKNAIVVGGYRLLKVDTLDNQLDFRKDPGRNDPRGQRRARGRSGLFRLPARHFQPPHYPRIHQAFPRQPSGSRTAKSLAGGATLPTFADLT